ncbi:uncharacterized protein RAG0_17231 [Rhynchosporium agropyri]|uniref:Uncharacterized protein n=1 Tax=Rhynchosporium agropyri TaxID=914238 RepID=A0A1E1LT97_9HELO|nr:uncharacterized protein RAG0_17231 [Rhynchosporium agropyri]
MHNVQRTIQDDAAADAARPALQLPGVGSADEPGFNYLPHIRASDLVMIGRPSMVISARTACTGEATPLAMRLQLEGLSQDDQSNPRSKRKRFSCCPGSLGRPLMKTVGLHWQMCDSEPTLDPRSLLHSSSNVLGTPSLNDVSKCKGTWGEAAVNPHDASPNLVHDRTELIFESHSITSGGVVRNDFLSDSSTNSRSASRISSPVLDEGIAYPTPTTPQLPGPSDLDQDQSSTARLSTLVPVRGSIAAPSMQGSGPFSMPNPDFMCPKCPRTFDGFIEASKHLQNINTIMHVKWPVADGVSIFPKICAVTTFSTLVDHDGFLVQWLDALTDVPAPTTHSVGRIY